MNKKNIILVICMLVIGTLIPVSVIGNEKNIDNDQSILYEQSYTNKNNFGIIIDSTDFSIVSNFNDAYEIYEGEHLTITITGHWSPPNPEKIICMWAEMESLPAGATFDPPCHCSPGEVASTFEWTPAIGQAGTYVIIFYLGEYCEVALGSFSITIIVYPVDTEPPSVTILGPLDDSEFTESDIVLTGYATDDNGIVSIGAHHRWEGDEAITSGTINPPQTYYPFEWKFILHEGWNEITIFVSDNVGAEAEAEVLLFNVISFDPPTTEEKNIYKAKMERWKSNLAPRSVDDIISSLGTDGLGTYVKVAERECIPPNDNFDKVEIRVKTRLVTWVDNSETENHPGFFWKESARQKIENRVKIVEVDFALMLDPDIARVQESDELGQMIDDSLLYHELLHGQLAINNWSRPDWNGWNELCKCNLNYQASDNYAVGDPDHEEIPSLEREYLGQIAEDRGYELEIRDIARGATDNGEISIEIQMPADKDPPYTWNFISTCIDNLEGEPINNGNTLKVTGTLPDGIDSARIWVWIDPPNYGKIVYVDIVRGGSPEKPDRPSGPTSGKKGQTYTYSSSSSDPNGDNVCYGWDWDGDGRVDEWTGFYASGNIVSTSHIWTSEFTGEIKVKAKDETDIESDWSDPLAVSMPKYKSMQMSFQKFLDQYPILYQLFQRLLKL